MVVSRHLVYSRRRFTLKITKGCGTSGLGKVCEDEMIWLPQVECDVPCSQIFLRLQVFERAETEPYVAVRHCRSMGQGIVFVVSAAVQVGHS